MSRVKRGFILGVLSVVMLVGCVRDTPGVVSQSVLGKVVRGLRSGGGLVVRGNMKWMARAGFGGTPGIVYWSWSGKRVAVHGFPGAAGLGRLLADVGVRGGR
ncbi:MAG: hypothetical protein B7Z66_12060 [Chromatiales bacterium 21-64-14]|nr:MAG: hypothetical protein B7Z66_12060 [Chromatiales bacterium 21-64-14]